MKQADPTNIGAEDVYNTLRIISDTWQMFRSGIESESFGGLKLLTLFPSVGRSV